MIEIFVKYSIQKLRSLKNQKLKTNVLQVQISSQKKL
jgi:hypothetical protein